MLDKVRLVNRVILETEEGIEPVIPFPLKANLSKYFKFPIVVDKGPRTLFAVKSRPTIERLVSQMTPNQLPVHGSPLYQFAELIQFTPLVELYRSFRA